MGRVLVTGASGFIGGHLIPALRTARHEVIAVSGTSGDVAEESTWAGFPDAEVVVHLAGKTFVPDSWTDPAGFIRSNLLGTIGALNYCRKHNAHLIFLSSYLYGNPEALPISETAPLVAMNPYALSKKLAEEACAFFSRSFAVDVTVFRPFNVYGRGQPDHFLIPSILRQVSAGQSIQVQDLEPRRDYIYVSDLTDAIVSALNQRRGFRTYNIGTGKSHSVSELIEVIQGLLQTRLTVTASGERRINEILECRADISAARLEISWKPRVTLEAGLRRMLQ